uniref:Uncharacterized protein n=1 Tax=Octactis speculum TaxID=3111310 RepID=A0A7S2DB33_9STRA|mmetsp:Transcript_46016/g.62585  ORF Transcript_46016/g.62585 Transcript_46016/m.62585 type:complete len:105 (+) Transcript_46016:59-373(+)
MIAVEDPMYWLMPLGLSLGILVVILFEKFAQGGRGCRLYRESLLSDAKGKIVGKIDPLVEEVLQQNVDSASNVAGFWTGTVSLHHVSTLWGYLWGKHSYLDLTH